jgi:hypothetical protein
MFAPPLKIARLALAGIGISTDLPVAFIGFNTDPAMQAQDDIVKAILSSLPTSGSGDQDGLPSLEQAILQAENFIRAVSISLLLQNADRTHTPLTLVPVD